jgi:exopolysaccharide production protein ExoY
MRLVSRIVGVYEPRPSALGNLPKRLLDVFIVVPALICLAPLLLMLAILVKFSDGGSIFYSHTRVGLGGAQFGCLKFRTMRPNSATQLADYLRQHPAARTEWEQTRKLKHDPRVTAVGQILRRTSLDELPQLFNVLWGEMSLVGPRPITVDEMPRYGENIPAYLSSRPGLTGHWQTSGRSDVSYENRVSLDVHYLQNWSLWFDLLIMARTVPVLLFQRGSY